MEHDRNVTPDVDDTTVSVTSSLYDVQTLLNDDSDAHEDGHAVLREAVQVTSHGRVVSNAVHERPVTIHGRRLPFWPQTWMPRRRLRIKRKRAGTARATDTLMVWFPFTPPADDIQYRVS